MSWKCKKKNNCYSMSFIHRFSDPTQNGNAFEMFENPSQNPFNENASQVNTVYITYHFFSLGSFFFPSFLLQNPSFIGMLASILRLEPGGVPHRIFPFPVPHQGDRRPEHPRARLLRKRRRQGGAHGALPLAHLRVWLRVVSPGVKTTPTTPRGGYMGTPK